MNEQQERDNIEAPRCIICGEPMPEGEEMFKYHGYSCNCPKPPLQTLEAQGMNEMSKLELRSENRRLLDRVKELEQHNFNLMDQINRLEAQKEHIYASNAALIEQRDAALKLVDEWENYAEKMRSSTLPAPATVTLSATEVVDRIRAIYADQEKKCPICGGGEHRCEACLIEHELP